MNWEEEDIYFNIEDPKTSPIHKPNFDYDFDLNLNSPLSTPNFQNNQFIKKKKNLEKKKFNIFRPFLSFEATEITVHQLRSILHSP